MKHPSLLYLRSSVQPISLFPPILLPNYVVTFCHFILCLKSLHVHSVHLSHSPFATHIQLFHIKTRQYHACTMLLSAGWKGSKGLQRTKEGSFCFVLKHLQIVLLEQKHSRVSLLTKQPDTKHTELCLQTQWVINHFFMYVAVDFSRTFPDLAKSGWRHILAQWAYEASKERNVGVLYSHNWWFLPFFCIFSLFLFLLSCLHDHCD